MRLLSRIAIIWVVLGLVVGLVLRGQLSWRRLGALYALSALPWLAHLVYVVFYTLDNASGLALPLTLFALSSLVLGTLTLFLGWRFWRKTPLRLSFAPLLLALAHAPPLLVFSRALQSAGLGNAGLGMDAIPMVAFICAALFVASLLFAFTLGRGDGPRSGLPAIRPARRR